MIIVPFLTLNLLLFLQFFNTWFLQSCNYEIQAVLFFLMYP